MDHIVEPEKRVPVIAEADVVVAGGGIAGCMAALAAARLGVSTILVDRFGSLGGNMGPGMWAGGSLHLALRGGLDDSEALVSRRGLGGIPLEMVRRSLAYRLTQDELDQGEGVHFNVAGKRLGSDYLVDGPVVSYVLSQMMKEEGVEVMLSTYVADPILADGRVKGLYVENKSGRGAVLSKVVVDSAGDADIARRAGLQTNHSPNPGIGLFYAIGNVEWEGFRASVRDLSSSEESWMRDVMSRELGYGTHGIAELVPFAKEAWESGRYRIVQRIDGFGRIVTRKLREPIHGLVISRAETNGEIDPGNGRQISILEFRVREYIFETVQFLRDFVPGFGECYLHAIAPYLGARGGRWIDALYPISGQDLVEERQFDDVLYIYKDGKSGASVEVPYRAIVPKGLDGLIAAGRSSVPRSPNFRARYSMLLLGQAAGIAAAHCVRSGLEPRELDPRAVQRTILEWGSPLADDGRLEALGLRLKRAGSLEGT